MNDTPRNLFALNDLPKGACGLVSEVQNAEELARLQSMGVCIGRRLEVIQTGDPLIFRVFGSRIGLSARMAAHILVEPCQRAPRCWESRA